MKGFEIKINDVEPIYASSDRLVAIHFYSDDTDGYCDIAVNGKDSNFDRIAWGNFNLKLGDKIKVRVTDVETVSTVKSRVTSDRAEMKKRYLALKKELVEKGLI